MQSSFQSAKVSIEFLLIVALVLGGMFGFLFGRSTGYADGRYQGASDGKYQTLDEVVLQQQNREEKLKQDLAAQANPFNEQAAPANPFEGSYENPFRADTNPFAR